MSLTSALGMFTIAPVRAHELSDPSAALRWLPAIGLGLGALASLPVVAVTAWAPHAITVGAAVAIGLLALLTRGLHLDGLADTADGLGSRAPAERALAIMKQSDIGPFGVITLVVVLLVDVLALAATHHGTWGATAALATAAMTGRVAALQASAARPARTDGFGALVHGAAGPATRAAAAAGALIIGGVLAFAVSASWWWWALVQTVALAAAFALQRHTTRRFGGTTGDVYGALIETATAISLAGMCLR